MDSLIDPKTGQPIVKNVRRQVIEKNYDWGLYVYKKANAAKMENQESEEVVLSQKVETAHSMTLMDLQRENRLEQLIQKEEEEKEQIEEDELAKQYENERKKNDSLIKSIKEKQLEDQFNITKANTEAAIEKLKENAKKQIIMKRMQMKQKLAAMRKKSLRKKRQMKNDILSVRMEVAENWQKRRHEQVFRS